MYSAKAYKKRLKEKNCKYCGTQFTGTDKMVSCSKECTRKSKLNGMKINHHVVKCNTCGVVITDSVKYGTKSKDVLRFKKCSECCKKHRKQMYFERDRKIIERKINNPDLFISKTLTNGTIIYVNKNKSLSNQKRMQDDNPMKNPIISNKVGVTIKSRIEKGEITYKKGSENKRWKGNRDNNHFIRTQLKQWIKSVQIKNNWKCEMCCSNIKIEVHHTEPLRDIINKFSIKPLCEYKQDEIDFKILCELVVTYHLENDKIGQLLCKICHSKMDKNRRI